MRESGIFQSAAFLLLAGAAAAQSPQPSFEAADVKLNNSGEARMAVDFQPGGRLAVRNVPLKVVIALAYGVRPEAVTAGPPWIASDRFDMIAKASQTTPAAELRLMLRGLLAERFQLKLHTESRPSTAYDLSVAKSGAKLEPAESAPLTQQRCPPAEPIEGQKHYVCEHMTVALFAGALQEIAVTDIDAPVLDRTGLQGVHNFNLAWTPAAPAAADSSAVPAGPALADALETQLGLKLERKRLSLPVLVIDRVEHLSGN